jgi:hypothetical protein
MCASSPLPVPGKPTNPREGGTRALCRQTNPHASASARSAILPARQRQKQKRPYSWSLPSISSPPAGCSHSTPRQVASRSTRSLLIKKLPQRSPCGAVSQRMHAMAWPWPPPPPRSTAHRRLLFLVLLLSLLAATPWPSAAAQVAGYRVVSVARARARGGQLSARLELAGGAGGKPELGPDVQRLSLTARQVRSFLDYFVFVCASMPCVAYPIFSYFGVANGDARLVSSWG